jgi:hypothetical protein
MRHQNQAMDAAVTPRRPDQRLREVSGKFSEERSGGEEICRK